MPNSITQVTTCLAHGDGIGGIILGIDAEAKRLGIDSAIYAPTVLHPRGLEFLDPRLERLRAREKELAARRQPHVVIYHYGVRDRLLDHHFGRDFKEASGTERVFYYHNFTPPRFMRGWDRLSYRELKATRKSLDRLLDGPWTITGDSHFNISELPENPAHRRLAPVLPTPSNDSTRITPELLRLKAMTDIPSLVFVGRFSPNKRQDALLFLMRALLDAGLPCRLSLIGKGEGPYLDYLRVLLRTLKLRDHVNLVQYATSQQIRAYYRHSNYFVTTSQHEGFCVPVLESLRHGCIPIAWPACALGEILRGSPTLASEMSLDAICKKAHEVIRTTFGVPDHFVSLFSSVEAQVQANLATFDSKERFLRSLFAPKKDGP
jgi:glycosyltransferase involved in cell wall biosynthesis